MSITLSTYFNGLLSVPADRYSQSALATAISQFEPKYLKGVLGYAMWKEFTEAVAASVLDVEDENYVALSDKWDELLNGAEFSFDFDGVTHTRYWNGFLNTELISPIANYVYYQYRKGKVSNFSGASENVPKSENAETIDPSLHIMQAWNEMIDMTGKTPAIYRRRRKFPYELSNYIHYDNTDSLYNFLLANKDTYNTWEFSPYVLGLFKLTGL